MLSTKMTTLPLFNKLIPNKIGFWIQNKEYRYRVKDRIENVLFSPSYPVSINQSNLSLNSTIFRELFFTERNINGDLVFKLQ